MNIFNPKTTSLSLKCDVKTTGGDQAGLTIQWKRNGAYVGNSSQVDRIQTLIILLTHTLHRELENENR